MVKAQYENIDITLERILIKDTIQRGLTDYILDRDIWYGLSYPYFIERFRETREHNQSEEVWIERITYVYPLLARIPVKKLETNTYKKLAILERQYYQCSIFDFKTYIDHMSDKPENMKRLKEWVLFLFNLANEMIQYGSGHYNFPTTSRLLHFMFPDLFPVFDQKICRVLYGNDQVDDLSKYITYLLAIQKYLSSGAFHQIIMQEARAMNVSPLRIIDLKLMNYMHDVGHD